MIEMHNIYPWSNKLSSHCKPKYGHINFLKPFGSGFGQNNGNWTQTYSDKYTRVGIMRDLKFIQKHCRGLNWVPAHTCIIACLNQLRYRCHNIFRNFIKSDPGFFLSF